MEFSGRNHRFRVKLDSVRVVLLAAALLCSTLTLLSRHMEDKSIWTAAPSTLLPVQVSSDPMAGIYQKQHGQWGVFLQAGQSLIFRGVVSMRVVRGTVEVLGTRYTPSEVFHRLMGPRSAVVPGLALLAVASGDQHQSKQLGELECTLLSHNPQADVVLLLQAVDELQQIGQLSTQQPNDSHQTQDSKQVIDPFDIPNFFPVLEQFSQNTTVISGDLFGVVFDFC